MQGTLHRAGLVVNGSKSAWQPSHEVQWLGFVVNLEEGCICQSVQVKKVDALKTNLGAALGANNLSARHLASLIGKSIAMGLALGPISRFIACNALGQHGALC